ncbi:MAG: PAS domain S-box protein [Nitrospira sp.]|nr:PAS domain S-box protein [bacterium]MBL7048496.1 PAS domain S-box protein [Nitrospira sp.]
MPFREKNLNYIFLITLTVALIFPAFNAFNIAMSMHTLPDFTTFIPYAAVFFLFGVLVSVLFKIDKTITAQKDKECLLEEQTLELASSAKESAAEVIRTRKNLQRETSSLESAKADLQSSFESLKRVENNFKLLTEISPNMIFITDREKILQGNTRCEAILGFSRREISSGVISLHRLMPPELNPSQTIAPKFINTSTASSLEAMFLTKNMDIVNVIMTYTPIETNLQDALLIVASDITQRKKNEAELEEYRQLLNNSEIMHFSAEQAAAREENWPANCRPLPGEDRYKSIFESSPQGIIVYDPSGMVIDANPASLKIFGVHHISDLNMLNLFEMAEVSDEVQRRLIESGTISVETEIIFPEALINSTRSGTAFINASITYIKAEDSGFMGYMVMVRDITGQRQAESNALKSLHLTALSELTSGVAHEINNPINGILNYARIIANKSAPDSRESEIVARIIKESNRIAGIVRSLFTLAHDDKIGRRPAEIQDVILESLTLIIAQIAKDGITLDVSIPSKIPAVMIQPNLIEHVFMNIIRNARYALNHKHKDNGSKIMRISASKAIHESKPYVKISIYDNGSGLNEMRHSRINTQSPAEAAVASASLSLCICKNIIENHGGRFTVDSVKGIYTDISVMLPAYNGRR